MPRDSSVIGLRSSVLNAAYLSDIVRREGIGQVVCFRLSGESMVERVLSDALHEDLARLRVFGIDEVIILEAHDRGRDLEYRGSLLHEPTSPEILQGGGCRSGIPMGTQVGSLAEFHRNTMMNRDLDEAIFRGSESDVEVHENFEHGQRWSG